MKNAANIFDGEGYRTRLANLIYLRLMTRKWIGYADILADDNKGSTANDYRYNRSYNAIYGELKKAFMDVRKAIRRVEGDNAIEEDGCGRSGKRFRYVGKVADPLCGMRNAKAIKDIRKYYEFCQDSAGFFPKSWLEYFLKDSMDLLEMKKRKQKGEQIIGSSLERQLKNIDMLPYLYEAIRSHTVLAIRYKPFDEEEMNLVFHPHFIKEFNGRWHLLGHAEGKIPSNTFNLPLDRIEGDPQALDSKEYIPAPEHFYEHYFDGILGTTHWDNEVVHNIHIRAYTNYMFHIIDTKTIHDTQEIVKPYGKYDDGEYGEFVVRVELNNEFIGRILQMGDGLEVVAPKEIRLRFKERVDKLAARYTKFEEDNDS